MPLSPFPPGLVPPFRRRLTGRGRPYPADVVAQVRGMVEGTALPFREIGERTGVGPATIARWAHRFDWVRKGVDRSSPPRVPPDREATSRCAEPGVRSRRAGSGRLRRNGAAEHEAARALIEGTRLGLEPIALRLGLGSATLARWKRRFGWRRPPPPEKPWRAGGCGPVFYRSQKRRGRPYGADAVATAQRLVTSTLLPQARIAAAAGVSQATVSRWMARRNWSRPRPVPGIHRFAAARRTAPVVSSGDRRGRAYAPEVVAAARELFEQTELSSALIAARVHVSAVTVTHWGRRGGWTRPRDLPDLQGRRPSRRRRRASRP